MNLSQYDAAVISMDAINVFGKDNQFNQSCEEFAELIMTLNHFRRGRASSDDLTSEIIDCYIMLDQLVRIMDITETTIQEVYAAKMTKLANAIVVEKISQQSKLKESIDAINSVVHAFDDEIHDD